MAQHIANEPFTKTLIRNGRDSVQFCATYRHIEKQFISLDGGQTVRRSVDYCRNLAGIERRGDA